MALGTITYMAKRVPNQPNPLPCADIIVAQPAGCLSWVAC